MDYIHVATEADFAELLTIEEQADQIFAQVGISELPDIQWRSGKGTLVLVAGKPPIGFAWLETVDGCLHLEQISVLPKHMGGGVGTQLLEEACEWGTSHGFKAITLSTFRAVPWNMPFYARHGFVELTKLTPGLKKLRDHETELGLDKLGERVVMRRILGIN